jgi:hypothetical protein
MRPPPRPARAAACLLLAGTLGGCGVEIAGTPALGALAALEVGSIVVLNRGVADTAVSLVTGRDCSVVRLAREESYCRPEEAAPAPPPFCTRSLGTVDCWRVPPPAYPPQRGLADGPATLTPAQEAHRTRRWPGLFSAR